MINFMTTKEIKDALLFNVEVVNDSTSWPEEIEYSKEQIVKLQNELQRREWGNYIFKETKE